MNTVAISELKAKCLRLVARVGETGRPLVVTKNGKPIARVVPFSRRDTLKKLRGSAVEIGDIISPIDADWESMR